MGGKSSKAVSGQEVSSQGRADSQFESDLSSYEAACRNDSTLQQFDATLHQRTNDVIGTLAAGLGVQSLSFDSFKQVTGCLLETNQEVVKIILECHKDIWKNPDLFSLVEEYFENSKKTLEFCTALENCLKRARNNQLIIQLAVTYFEEEVGLQVGDGERKFVKTLEELKKFKTAEEPFTKEFFILFDLVRRQQELMLRKLQARKRKLDKKLKSLKTWRRVSNVLFVATFVSVLIFSVVAAAIAAPPVVTALAAALAVPIGSVGKWCNWLWKRYENELKGQKELIIGMEIGSWIAINDLENIRVLISRFEIEIESLLHNTDFALREEDALKLAIDEIKRKLEAFMTIIEELGQQANTCGRNIRMARTVVLQKMMKRSGSSSTGDSPWEL
ncbi:UPF0496 protein 1 [Hibiscus syriacus]|uniref:UPF0496 protein 1 n=1 Tax=Hibiscus syriacus TaxID=106335 RepID=A0A6A3AGU6_HIBSY|nr:UPF0496 protein At2g18630-like [Hibiscus syriacus]XP_039000948.1 UPF0496 protein At2g18630-like [Hibiscus syriacus]XP_039000949.1 UPF0496 protein At2g18630-like [Hibiscus syriacus]KAE8703801.1 UPF0496 protein 1 [Hibiscus syriacus]